MQFVTDDTEVQFAVNAKIVFQIKNKKIWRSFIYCKLINVCEGLIWRISRPSLNRKNKCPANIIHALDN